MMTHEEELNVNLVKIFFMIETHNCLNNYPNKPMMHNRQIENELY